jgi:polyvinyl alcohol dehydrogenase (cytochrome)
VHALRADSGCLQWTFQANGPDSIGDRRDPERWQAGALFGRPHRWFYALDASNGQLVWRKRPDDHEAVRVSAPPVVHDGIAYVAVASWKNLDRSIRVSLLHVPGEPSSPCAFATAAVAWKTHTIPTAAASTGRTSAGTPTFGPSGCRRVGRADARSETAQAVHHHRQQLLNAGDDDERFDHGARSSDTGRIVWSKQVQPSDVYNRVLDDAALVRTCPAGNGPDYDFGSPAVLVSTTGWTRAARRSAVRRRVGVRSGQERRSDVGDSAVGQAASTAACSGGMASDGEYVYAAASDAVATRRRRRDSRSEESAAGLTALRIADGQSRRGAAAPPPCADRPNCSPAQSAALTAIPGVVFSGSLDGHRARPTRRATAQSSGTWTRFAATTP